MVTSAWRHRQLLGTMIRREIVGRYRGSVMGLLWSLINPLGMLLVYTFVFSVVFKARWGEGSTSKSEFALIVFVGLVVFNLFSECVNRAPVLVLNNVNYVKKVVFPLEILPWVSIGVALFHTATSLVVWLVFHTVLFGWPHPTTLLLPIVLLPLVIFTLGLSWLLAALGVFLRDVGQIVGFITSALMFLSAIFYPVDALPPNYQSLLSLNPLTQVIGQARAVLVWGTAPDVTQWLGLLAGSMVVACLGFAWFQRTRSGFANVL